METPKNKTIDEVKQELLNAISEALRNDPMPVKGLAEAYQTLVLAASWMNDPRPAPEQSPVEKND